MGSRCSRNDSKRYKLTEPNPVGWCLLAPISPNITLSPESEIGWKEIIEGSQPSIGHTNINRFIPVLGLAALDIWPLPSDLETLVILG